MEKPDLTKVGLDIAEDAAKSVILKLIRPYAEYYIQQSETKIDDILLPFIGQLEEALLGLADKIDGEVG